MLIYARVLTGMGAIRWGTREMFQKIGCVSVNRMHEFVKISLRVHHSKKG